jgi:predicted ATP-grasp superfamily ATP-dependent carboligase
METALITNGLSPKSLVCARSLGKRGIYVIVCDCKRFAPTFFSKYCREHFLYPDPEKYPDDFVNTILNFLKRKKVDVILPMNSAETLLICKHKDKLSKYVRVPFGDYEKVMLVHDKKTLSETISNLRIKAPATHYIKNIQELFEKMHKISCPAVIKLRRSTGSRGIWYVNSKQELLTTYRKVVKNYCLLPEEYPIIQEYISGAGAGVSMLFDRGKMKAKFSHLRLREYPVSGGPSTLRISIKEEKMERIARKLMETIDWHGVVMVEFKLTRDGTPVLIEVNPRIWGSINEAVASGVDFPFLIYQLAFEREIPEVLEYKIGMKTRFIFNDIRAILKLLLSFKASSIQLKDIFTFFSKNLKYDVFSLEDPVPFLIYFFWAIKELLIPKR